MNIKKFAQEKFDPKAAGKLGDRKDEPSPSETVIDLNLGDMVVDVKKLKKESSFNIDSPVGTAGIRGTVPAIQVLKLPDGGFTQNTSMLRGEIAFTPRAGGPATFLGPGQSLSIGIGANGLMLPAQLGRVDASVMKAIEAEVEQAAAATGAAPADNEPSGETPQGASEEDAPSEDELNESDDERQASAKGVGGDENSTDAVALEKAGLIDLDDPNEAAKADTYVEVAATAAEMLEDKSGRRSSSSTKNDDIFLEDLVDNFDSVVDVTEESIELGIKSTDLIQKTAESAENAPVTNSNLGKVRAEGVDDKTALQELIKTPSNSDEIAIFIDEIIDTDTDRRSSNDKAEKLAAMGRNTAVANEMKDAKDKGVDSDTIINSAVAISQVEIEAEDKQAELIASGVNVDPELIRLIQLAPNEDTINEYLLGKENETYYQDLLALKDARLKVLEATLKKTKSPPLSKPLTVEIRVLLQKMRRPKN